MLLGVLHRLLIFDTERFLRCLSSTPTMKEANQLIKLINQADLILDDDSPVHPPISAIDAKKR